MFSSSERATTLLSSSRSSLTNAFLFASLASAAGAAKAKDLPPHGSPPHKLPPHHFPTHHYSTVETIERIAQRVDDDRVQISLVDNPHGLPQVQLVGVVKTEAEAKAALAAAKLFVGNEVSGVVSLLEVDAKAPPKKPYASVTGPRPSYDEKGIKAKLEAALGEDPRITTRVFSLGNNHWGVSLDGIVPTAEERDGILATVEAFVPSDIDRVASQVRVSEKAITLEEARKQREEEGKEAVEKPKTVDIVWPLTFGPESIGDADSSKITGNRYEIDNLVKSLNIAYKSKSTDVDIVQATRHSLLIRGQADVVYQIRRQLALLDAPGPQVQMDLWTTQLSGKGAKNEELREKMATRLALSQALMRKVPILMESAIAANWTKGLKDVADVASREKSVQANYSKFGVDMTDKSDSDAIAKEVELLRSVNFDLNPYRRMTLPEILIFLSIPDKATKKKIFATMEQAIEKYVADSNDPDLKRLYASQKGQDIQVDGVRSKWRPFWRLEEAYVTRVDGGNAARNTIIKFLEAFVAFRQNPTYKTEQALIQDQMKELDPELYKTAKERQDKLRKEEIEKARQEGRKPETVKGVQLDTDFKAYKEQILNNVEFIRNSPEIFAREAAAGDMLFKLGSDCLSADIEELILKPLFNDLKLQNASIKSSGGVALIGRTRLVVTSGMQSSLKPEFQGSVDSTIPMPFDPKTLLETAIVTPEKEGVDKTGLERLINGLPQTQAILLAGALAKPVVPAFTNVAPGVGIIVRPTVFGNGASARLQIEAAFGVESKAPEASEDGNTFAPQPVDTVKTHKVTTDASIDALDLFEISGFGIVTRHPRGPGYVPVIGRLPLIGEAFQWKRKDTQIEHDSHILVNTVILPRSFDIVRHYSTMR